MGKYTCSLLLKRSSGTWLQEYSTMPRALEILSSILDHIEYSYDHTQVPAGYLYSLLDILHITPHYGVMTLLIAIHCVP